MVLEEKSIAVSRLCNLVDNVTGEFREQAGLKCLKYCCRCCINPRLSVTILEFLPLAFQLFKKRQLNRWLLKFKELHPVLEESCVLLAQSRLDPGTGRCTVYKFRPLICRLFGFSGMLDKYGKSQYVTCQVIKQRYRTIYEMIKDNPEEFSVPVMKNYYMMLFSIDIDMAQRYYPINTAFRKALETVAAYTSYPRPKFNGFNLKSIKN